MGVFLTTIFIAIIASTFTNTILKIHAFSTNYINSKHMAIIENNSFTTLRRTSSFYPTAAKRHMALAAAVNGNISEAEVRELILTISREQDDDKRRSELSSTMQGNISAKGGEFAEMWDKTLIQIGAEFQDELKRKAEENQGKEDESLKDKTDERQLWALIDMMVQSKMLIKKAINNQE